VNALSFKYLALATHIIQCLSLSLNTRSTHSSTVIPIDNPEQSPPKTRSTMSQSQTTRFCQACERNVHRNGMHDAELCKRCNHLYVKRACQKRVEVGADTICSTVYYEFRAITARAPAYCDFHVSFIQVTYLPTYLPR